VYYIYLIFQSTRGTLRQLKILNVQKPTEAGASPVATGGFGGLSPLQSSKPPKLKYETL